MLPPPSERPKLAALLAQLAAAVEELVLSGLTTASEATRQTLAAAAQEAARYRLLRLGSTLRTAAEELGRFTAHDAAFARARLTFFLSRAWLLSRGLAQALATADEQEYDRLTWTPPTQPLPRVEVVCLGAAKRVSVGAFVAFEFRLRALAGAAPVTPGQRLTWSVIFPVKSDLKVPPEGFLHLPQKQKFTASVFLEQRAVTIERAQLVRDNAGDRLTLSEQSSVAPGAPFHGWSRFLDWSSAAALERLGEHIPSPLDLDTELQEEVVLRDYALGSPSAGDIPGRTVYPITSGRFHFAAIVGPNPEGKALRTSLDELRKLKKNRPPLYGLMHYERCRLTLQPLTAFRPAPDYLTISPESVNKAALLKALSYT